MPSPNSWRLSVAFPDPNLTMSRGKKVPLEFENILPMLCSTNDECSNQLFPLGGNVSLENVRPFPDREFFIKR